MIGRVLAASAVLFAVAPPAPRAEVSGVAPPPVTAKAAKPTKTLQVLVEGEVDPSHVLAPPPSDDTPAGGAQLAEVKRIVAARTPERLAQARWDDAHEDPSAFYATLGRGFDLDRLPQTRSVLVAVQNDDGIEASRAKKIFARRRPWAVDPTIATCDPNDNPTASFPSGHATMGWGVAMTLAALIPEKAPALMARAADYAVSRTVCGSHYPSDTEASQVLSAAVVTAMARHPSYASALHAAHAELVAAGYAAP